MSALRDVTGARDSDELLAQVQRGGLVRADQANQQRGLDETVISEANTRTLNIFDVSKKAVMTAQDGQLRDILCILARLGIRVCSDEVHSGRSVLKLYIAILGSMKSDAAVGARTRLQSLQQKLDGLTGAHQIVKADAYATVMMCVPPLHPRPRER